MIPVPISVPTNYAGLVLLTNKNSSFYLQIPLARINSFCLKPLKYLLFLGWCILGVEGELSVQCGGEGVDPDGQLNDQDIYYYVANTDILQAVDLEVIRIRSNVPSETTQTREDFRTKLLERDVFCVWTGVTARYGNGLHIIPFRRGTEWLRLILENRPHYEEDVTNFSDINDIRNGVFANPMIHDGFDSRDAVVLKTPNHYLHPDDIPPRSDRTLSNDVTYPSNSRYSLQWLNPDPNVIAMIPNNRDAAFKKHSRKPKPSSLLLHYNYGAAAVKCWGRGTQVLYHLFKPPRPGEPVPAPVGPSRNIHDRNIAIQKREEAQKGGRVQDTNRTGTKEAEVGSGKEEQVTWDEDDVIIFFWGNSRAAKERHAWKVQENVQRMEKWRKGLPSVC